MKRSAFILLLSIFSITGFSQTFPVDTLLFNGNTNDRINLVILSDGYQDTLLDDFLVDATDFMNLLLATSPYSEYKAYFNVFTISVPSNENGASHPGTATDVTEPAHPVSTVDNYFGSTFDWSGIHRLLVPAKSGVVFTTLANNFPMYDQVVIIVNSPHYGGSGGQFATASTSFGSAQIAIHELGHSFVNLADEYFAGASFAAERANMTQETDSTKVKWKNWHGDNGIGIFQHCCGSPATSWYKPHQSCAMQFIGQPFCSVCKEATIEVIHSLTNPVDAFTPSVLTTTVDQDGAPFYLDLVKPNPNTLNVHWELNGNTLITDVDSVFICKKELIEGNNTLSVTVHDTTDFLRIDGHQNLHFQLISWSIDNADTTGAWIACADSSRIIDTSGNTDTNATSIVLAPVVNAEIAIHPNPTAGNLDLEIDNGIRSTLVVGLYDLQGKKVKTFFDQSVGRGTHNFELDLSTLPSGIYLLRMLIGDQLISRRIIKE